MHEVWVFHQTAGDLEEQRVDLGDGDRVVRRYDQHAAYRRVRHDCDGYQDVVVRLSNLQCESWLIICRSVQDEHQFRAASKEVTEDHDHTNCQRVALSSPVLF